MANIDISVQSFLKSGLSNTITIDDASTVAQLKTAVSNAEGTDTAIMEFYFDGTPLEDNDVLSNLNITTGSVIRSSNTISGLATKELKQIAKLDLASLIRALDGKSSGSYDITYLPTRYDDNDVVINPNTDGLLPGRPWVPTVVARNLQLYLDASNTDSYSGTGTTWTDLSTNGYSTTLVDSPTFNTTHFTFDGVNDYVDTNQSLASESFSVGVWFRTTATGINMMLSKEEAAGRPWNYRMWLNSGELRADMGQGLLTPELIFDGGYNDGEWYFGMFTRDDDDWHLYVNGQEVATRSDPLTGTVSNSQELWIGRSAFTSGGTNPTGSYPYDGDIAQVFVYDDVLTATEVLQIYNATKNTL